MTDKPPSDLPAPQGRHVLRTRPIIEAVMRRGKPYVREVIWIEKWDNGELVERSMLRDETGARRPAMHGPFINYEEACEFVAARAKWMKGWLDATVNRQPYPPFVFKGIDVSIIAPPRGPLH